MTKKKTIIIGAIVATVLAAGLLMRASAKPPTNKYKEVRVERATVTELVSETGNLNPAASNDVFSNISGRIDELFVGNGDSVEAGQSLFRVVNDSTGQKRTITAPADGTVVNLGFSTGDKVSGTDAQTAGQTPVLVIADLSRYTIKLMINEVDRDKIKTGQSAEVVFDALPDDLFKAEVERLDTVGTNTQGVITYNVYLRLKDPTADLRPGMTANADIEVAKKANVLTVPSGAVKPYRGGKAVRVAANNGTSLRYVPVEVGVVGVSKTEIEEGITNGQKIVIGEKAKASGGLFGGPPAD